VVLVVSAVALGGAVAWACVPQANLVTLSPRSSGPSGTEVTVEGLGLDPGPVEIRWNEADGPLLGEGSGPNLSVPVTIPDAPEGLYIVVLLARQPGGGVGNTARAAFQVTGSGEMGTHSPSSPGTDGVPGDRVLPVAPSGTPTVLTLAAGAGLLALGVMIGALLARRRPA
jgi:hypothetical protein